MMNTLLKAVARHRRQARVRRKVTGSDARPRLSVFRSAKHIYVQVISDQTGRTLAAASTMSPSLRDELRSKGSCEAARKVGATIAQVCQERGIRRVVFDRNGFLFQGRVKALAEAAREGGLQF
jgi:large subunit ribosomal protein L18